MPNSGYTKLADLTRCLCWAHLRKKFVDALPKDTHNPEATLPSEGIAYCNKLFEIEKSLETLSSEERHMKRLEREKLVLDAFWAWVESARGKVLSKSKLGEALKYARNHKREFMNYLLDGNCSISNNLAENSIRPFTIGRKNWLFSGSPKGAAASAAIPPLPEQQRIVSILDEASDGIGSIFQMFGISCEVYQRLSFNNKKELLKGLSIRCSVLKFIYREMNPH